MHWNNELENSLKFFINKIPCDAKVCFITGGGTSVPIEKNTIRKITNISTGKRSVLCTEYFLNKDYYVILLLAKSAMKPFLHRLENIFDNDCNIDNVFQSAKVDYEKSKDKLLLVKFDYLDEYLELLENIMISINKNRENVLTILAAAVSDFYIPEKYMPEHKFSDNNIYQVFQNLTKTQKDLRKLYEAYGKNMILVTFKLETNRSLLEENCKNSLRNIGHQIVIGNILETRNTELWIYQENKIDHISDNICDDIEKILVEKLAEIHMNAINNTKNKI